MVALTLMPPPCSAGYGDTQWLPPNPQTQWTEIGQRMPDPHRLTHSHKYVPKGDSHLLCVPPIGDTLAKGTPIAVSTTEGVGGGGMGGGSSLSQGCVPTGAGDTKFHYHRNPLACCNPSLKKERIVSRMPPAPWGHTRGGEGWTESMGHGGLQA